MPDELPAATRARLEEAARNEYKSFPQWLCDDINAVLAAQAQAAETAEHYRQVCLQMHKDRAQAAPVLAAVEGWFQRGHSYPEYDAAEHALRTAYYAWHAAREG